MMKLLSLWRCTLVCCTWNYYLTGFQLEFLLNVYLLSKHCVHLCCLDDVWIQACLMLLRVLAFNYCCGAVPAHRRLGHYCRACVLICQGGYIRVYIPAEIKWNVHVACSTYVWCTACLSLCAVRTTGSWTQRSHNIKLKTNSMSTQVQADISCWLSHVICVWHWQAAHRQAEVS